MARLGAFMLLVILICQISANTGGSKNEDQRETIMREFVSIWRNSGGWYPPRKPPTPDPPVDQQVHKVVRNIVGGLKTLGLLPKKSISLPSLRKPLDRHRLSGFLYNISMYLQEMGAELEDHQQSFGDDQFWEKLLYSFFQSEAGSSFGSWGGRGDPPRPSFKLQDFFLSLRGSPHWDWLLGLVESILGLSVRQPQRPILDFLSQNWRTISALLEVALQALVSGTYGQASAGLQGFMCILRGRTDCSFNLGWLQQLLSFLETRNWKPVVNLHPPGVGMVDQREGVLSAGHFKPFSVPPEVLREEAVLGNRSGLDPGSMVSVQTLLLQALSRSGAGERAVQFAEHNPALLQGLDGLRRGLLHRVGSNVYGNLRRKVTRVTMALLDDVGGMVGEPQTNQQGICTVGDLRQLILWGIKHNLTWNAQAMGFSSHGPPSTPPFMACISSSSIEEEKRSGGKAPTPSSRRSRLRQHPLVDQNQGDADLSASAEILEAACNYSIPGLTGVSNFTVFLYCNLFEGPDTVLDSELGQVGPDLHATCSNAAWYLSAAEDDFMWVHVCSEFFAHEFNNTVCANSSFWIQRAHYAAVAKDYSFLNQSSIDELCEQLEGDVPGGSDASEDCLALLGTPSLSAHDFRRCFLPNNSALIGSLCGSDSSSSLDEASWAGEFCSQLLSSSSSGGAGGRLCDYTRWPLHRFTNQTLVELCEGREGLKDFICRNSTVLLQLVQQGPFLAAFCGRDPQGGPDGRCVLRQLFDMLPAPYDFDTAQLCTNPGPVLLDVLGRLSRCEGPGDERLGWLATVSYVLRMLDFVVGLSAGLEQGEQEVRQGLGQAILLSSLHDNGSFWATLRPNASVSVLQTVSVFLRREQNPALKEDLLSCFSPVLWDLIQREDNSSALSFLLQEYLQMPRESIRTLVLSAERDAVKRFLSHVHQSWDQLQVESIQASQKEQQAMETMTAAFIHRFPRVTPEIFLDLSPFLPYMSVSDIRNFPASLMVNDSVLSAIRDHSSEMKSMQKQAFVKRLLQSNVVGDVPSWPPYFLSSILPLLPHLPVSHFQQLTSTQLSPLLELLGNSSLDSTRGRHVLRTLFTRKRNLTVDNLLRLGILMCYLNPEDVRPLLSSAPLSPALWQPLAQCISDGHVSATGRLSHWLTLALRPLNISAMSPPTRASLRGLLPQLGAQFLRPLATPELLHLLTLPGVPTFPPAQAVQILNRLSEDTNVIAATVCGMRALLPGLGPWAMRYLAERGPTHPGDWECWRPLLSELQPAHRAMVQRALQQALRRSAASVTLQMQCLLPTVSLRGLDQLLDGETVLQNLSLYKDLAWAPQQAQLLLRKLQQTVNITRQNVQDLGSIAGGVSCDWLRQWTNETDFAELLQFITDLPGDVRPALRRCLIEELRKRPDVDLNTFAPAFAAVLPVTMMEHLSNATLAGVLEHVWQHFTHFLQLPRHKQLALAERASGVLGVTEEGVLGETVERLGPLLPYLDQQALALVDRPTLKLRLDELSELCLPADTSREIATLLTAKDMLGDPSSWAVADVEAVGRLMLTLSLPQIRALPLKDIGPEAVEHVLGSQRRWEQTELGRACREPHGQREKIQSLVTVVTRAKRKWWWRRDPVPSCADIKGTFPSAWGASQLGRMARRELQGCVEVIGQDRSLSPDQRAAVWTELRQVYRPVRRLRPEQVLELGCVVTEMSESELQAVDLSDLAVMAHLGTLNQWSTRKRRAAVVGILRRRRQKLQELGVVELVSLGHLICGLSASEMSRLSPYNLSVAAVFLRELALACSEQQMEMLTNLLSSPLAFGPISEWGPEVFTEIGTLAAGMADLVLTALVREQIEGLTPAAISVIPPRKMAVVFSARQLSWLSSEQAWAVTEEQWAELDMEQRQALGTAQYEGDTMPGHRGRNHALSVRRADHITKALLISFWTLWSLV